MQRIQHSKVTKNLADFLLSFLSSHSTLCTLLYAFFFVLRCCFTLRIPLISLYLSCFVVDLMHFWGQRMLFGVRQMCANTQETPVNKFIYDISYVIFGSLQYVYSATTVLRCHAMTWYSTIFFPIVSFFTIARVGTTLSMAPK